ncbi:Detected protein of unknown function [Hibiscus syriacus]|uniref:PPM-type phosphatase domain-containing protein n=1 Tax=Hibiscus syriacus TaxID=106335 RepID=A0A6A3BAP2_HIBSY|nr:Detected protein of unknown function [Hibiscus syriacus]
MGVCISVASSEIQEADVCHQDSVLFLAENVASLGIQGLGSLYTKQGSKGLNQDAAILYQDYGMEGGAFCGVFDGHGNNGHVVSNMSFLNWQEACISAFKVLDMEIMLQQNLDCSTSGTTAAVVVRQVWDVLNNHQVATIVTEAENEQVAARAVVDVARASWKNKFPSSKVDDCNVVCLFLQKKQKPSTLPAAT